MRIWLMKITIVLERLIEAVSLRSAWPHQPRLQAGHAVAHLAFELGARHQRGNRIDHQHVDGARAHQGVADFQRLLPGIGLRDQEIVHVDAELCGHRSDRARARRR